jgi:hypothetical protein
VPALASISWLFFGVEFLGGQTTRQPRQPRQPPERALDNPWQHKGQILNWSGPITPPTFYHSPFTTRLSPNGIHRPSDSDRLFENFPVSIPSSVVFITDLGRHSSNPALVFQLPKLQTYTPSTAHERASEALTSSIFIQPTPV